MAEHYPESLFKLLGVSEEEGLKTIKKSKLTDYQIGILYKRWGDTFDGTNRNPEDRMEPHEVRELTKKIIPTLRSNIIFCEKQNESPIIIEHEEIVNKYLGERKIIENYLVKSFPKYNVSDVKKIINGLIKVKKLDFNNYELIKKFVEENYSVILSKIEEADIEKIEDKKEILNQEHIFYKILADIKNKSFSIFSLEELIIATKISMLKNNLRNYDNCINVLSYLFDNPFSVFRILKTGLTPKSNLLITTALYVTDEKKNPYLDIKQLIEFYYNGLDSGYSKEDIISILAEHFKLSKKFVLEILKYLIPDFDLTSNKGRA